MAQSRDGSKRYGRCISCGTRDLSILTEPAVVKVHGLRNGRCASKPLSPHKSHEHRILACFLIEKNCLQPSLIMVSRSQCRTKSTLRSSSFAADVRASACHTKPLTCVGCIPPSHSTGRAHSYNHLDSIHDQISLIFGKDDCDRKLSACLG